MGLFVWFKTLGCPADWRSDAIETCYSTGSQTSFMIFMLGRTISSFFVALAHLFTPYPRRQPTARSTWYKFKAPDSHHGEADTIPCHRLPFGALLFRRRQLLFHRSHRGDPNIRRRMHAWEAQLRWGMTSICRTTGIWAVDLALIRIIQPGANQSTTTLLSLKTRKE